MLSWEGEGEARRNCRDLNSFNEGYGGWIGVVWRIFEGDDLHT
jgi:hypothetical protein